MIDSNIIKSSEYMQHIETWLGEFNKTSNPGLLYRASHDRQAQSYFRWKCDDKGITLVNIDMTEGSVFGGYSYVPQTILAIGDYKSPKGEFLYGLKCHADFAPTKMILKPDTN